MLWRDGSASPYPLKIKKYQSIVPYLCCRTGGAARSPKQQWWEEEEEEQRRWF